jgi:hypothetical protein
VEIDGRGIELRKLLVELKEIMCSSCGKEADIDILVKSYSDSKKLSAFALMSGYKTSIEKKEEYCIVRISGHACCV